AGSGKMWIDDLQLTVDGKSFAKAPARVVIRSGAELDTAFHSGSGITQISLDAQMIDRLTNLGMLWGFLKYHHPAIGLGDRNWDADLFRFLPHLIAVRDKDAANAVFEQWVDSLGKPAPCKACKPIVKDGNVKFLPDYGLLFDKDNFSSSLREKLEWIKNNRSQGKQYYIAGGDVGNPDFRNEYPYKGMSNPDAGIRLLALYRYWNMIQYFYPDKHLIGEDWNKVLTEFIPVFVQAGDSTAYHLACLKLIARIHDTHANIYGSYPALTKYFGSLLPPMETKFIEGKLVVSGFYTDIDSIQNKLKKGDIITKVDNEPVDALIKKMLPLTAASNYETQLRDLPLKILRSNEKKMTLEIDRDGTPIAVSLQRYDPKLIKMYIDHRPDSSYRLINDHIGYLYPGRYSNRQLPDIEKLFANTKGIVVDMRCYPLEFMPFTFGGWIKPKASPFAQFSYANFDAPGMISTGKPVSNGRHNADYYKGKIIVIVDASTQSQAEYTTIAFQSGPRTTVIGSTTAGADGNVSAIYLPGNIFTYISGLGVFYPDGRETQRVGVKIDIPLKPTLKGFREGRDELLEKAMELIEKD
ncbi:MAG: peptidase S41, partial [Bacteroidetes bacterium]|nr:peptidase S41 [Bacteroidota bacterium]